MNSKEFPEIPNKIPKIQIISKKSPKSLSRSPLWAVISSLENLKKYGKSQELQENHKNPKTIPKIQNSKNPENTKKSNDISKIPQWIQKTKNSKKENSKNPKLVHHFEEWFSPRPFPRPLWARTVDKIAENLITRKMSFLELPSLRSTVDVFYPAHRILHRRENCFRNFSQQEVLIHLRLFDFSFGKTNYPAFSQKVDHHSKC